MYRSPGFGVEIYFTTNGIDAVDSSDSWGCDTADWRLRLNQPNNVPDYVDEVAWAIDSAWSMEVVRFGFKAPYGIVSSVHQSPNYKVIIEEMGGYYGLTYFAGLLDGDTTGTRSIVTIRNEWQGWDINEIVDYQSHPEKAIRITCAHEFFHAVQFSMVHSVIEDVYLDKFPISWLEATATLMEELAFDYINDYTQYLLEYFNKPAGFSFFSQNDDYDFYANNILTLYLYHKSGRGIDFIKEIFESNYDTVSTISSLLEKASVSAGTTWPELLSKFHTESFYTGERADSGLFVPDSRIIDELNYVKGECLIGLASTKNILPYGVQIFSALKPTGLNESFLQVRCTMEGAPEVKPVLKLMLTGGARDTIISSADMHLNSLSIITDWGDHSEAIAVITNGSYDQNITVSTLFSDELLTTDNWRFSKGSPYVHPGIAIQKNAVVVPNGNCFVELYTLTGKRVYSESVAGPAVFKLFEYNTISNGAYIAKVRWGRETVEKIVMKRRGAL